MRFGVFVVVSILTLSLPSFGQGHTRLPDAAVQQIMDMARRNISQAKLSDGSFVPPETAQELAQPVVPLHDGRRVIMTGITSAFAKWCGVEWVQRNYRRFMDGERRLGVWSDRQIAYMGLLHGVTMGVFARQIKEKGESCSEQHRQRIETAIVGPPPAPAQ